MSSSLVRAVTVSLVILLPSLLVFAQTQATPKSIKSLGSVSGKVTIKSKGAPGISITLQAADSFNPFETRQHAITDQEGNYKIIKVAAGAYVVFFGALGYIPADNVSVSRSVVIGDGENVDDINFALVRGGVITGKITDADGRPLIQQTVRLLGADLSDQKTPQGQAQERQTITTSITDDRGIYRMFGLKSSRYKVAAGRGDYAFTGGSNFGRASYSEVFYPDAQDYAKATVLEVTEGSESTNIDIALGRPFETFSASGRVVDGEKGQPMANVRFALRRLVGDRAEFIPQLLMSDGLGQFTVEGLIPGKYSASMMSEINGDLRAENSTFDIIDADVTGLTFRLIKGAAISGVVVLENEDKRAFAKLIQLQVQAYVQPSSGFGMNSSSRATIGADGSFRLSGLATGTVNLSIGPPNFWEQMKGFVLSRIERDGVTQLRGLEIKEGEQITGVRIIVNYGTARLQGLVTIENGPLPDGARIFVQLLKTGETPNIRPHGVDERGHFLIDGLPSGSYEISASIAGGGVRPPRPVKQTVILEDGVTTDVNITLDLATVANP
jgi:hypothetical protein